MGRNTKERIYPRGGLRLTVTKQINVDRYPPGLRQSHLPSSLRAINISRWVVLLNVLIWKCKMEIWLRTIQLFQTGQYLKICTNLKSYPWWHWSSTNTENTWLGFKRADVRAYHGSKLPLAVELNSFLFLSRRTFSLRIGILIRKLLKPIITSKATMY